VVGGWSVGGARNGLWNMEFLNLQNGEFSRSYHEDWEQSETDDEAGQSC
jgi:hypothetical protein